MVGYRIEEVDFQQKVHRGERDNSLLNCLLHKQLVRKFRMALFQVHRPDSHGKNDMDTEWPIIDSGVTFTSGAAVPTPSDVFWDSYHTVESDINNSNSSGLLKMCDIVEETDCGPQWAMICLNVIGGLIVVLNVMHVLAVSATPQIRKSANAKGLFNLAAADLIYGMYIVC